MYSQEMMENNLLIGKKFVNTRMSGSPVCEVLAVSETFPKDIIFQSPDGYRHVEFASFVRNNLIEDEKAGPTPTELRNL